MEKKGTEKKRDYFRDTSFCNDCIYLKLCPQPKRHYVSGCGLKQEKKSD